MGRKIKSRIDWSIDKGNEAGDIVMLAQHTQTTLGVVSFLGQAPTYNYHAGLANRAYDQACLLHSRVLELPISNKVNARHLFDNELLADIYRSGSELIINLYLMFEHLALHAGITIFRSNNGKLFEEFERKDLKVKLKDIFVALGREDLPETKGYGALTSEIENTRHAINHPKGDNIYTTDRDKWDHVPIAWFVSGKHMDAYANTAGLYNQILDSWIEYTDAHKMPGEIRIGGPIVFEGYAATKKYTSRS